MNFEQLMNILSVSIISGIINTQAIQYIKINFNIKNNIIYVLVSFFIGALFAFSFTSFNLIEILWCGLISIIGAEALYKALEGKFGLVSKSKKN
ncbi:MAG: hypothetical protein RSB71_03020 [Bacilli bacterium]